jgi:hypothetical protein
MIAAVIGAVVMFGVLGYLSWETKYGRGRTVGAAAAIDTIVVHQRVMGHGIRGPVAQDRLVAIDGRTGEERTRITVLRGELVGARDDKVIYAIGKRLVLYDARTLEGSPAPDDLAVPSPTRFGAMVDLGDGVLYLETAAGNGRARASRLTKNGQSRQWTTELPWQGHETKLVLQLGGNVVIVDADGIAAVDRTRGDLAWTR